MKSFYILPVIFFPKKISRHCKHHTASVFHHHCLCCHQHAKNLVWPKKKSLLAPTAGALVLIAILIDL